MNTPGQTVGPFFGYALPWAGGEHLVPPSHPDAVHLHGTVYDGAGDPIPDALLEIWQADSDGNVPEAEGSLSRDGWTFTGFGRAATDGGGHFGFTTIVPGSRDGKAPSVLLTLFARGLLDRLFTRVHFPVDERALETDPLLSSLPAERRGTLVARRDGDGRGFVFDIRLQDSQDGKETVFLDFAGA